ncbi:family 81 glycosyl hydrolase [Truncatella angustata]|uniref:glucan endo-1,3-beta-D-glucosidase n=1 Tax=Truncatella angustata TaxID=152316 RepID=A0A9P8UDM1_9PEZI|nr:family 81 glycosyl hydrolase [Truncatella angustata]KAH6647977.1 family 81 glycosyl hydrolase [Truncatella angustata]
MWIYLLLTIFQINLGQGIPATYQTRFGGQESEARARENYPPVSATPVQPAALNPYIEGYLTVSIKKTSVPGSIAQLIPPLSTVKPDTTGIVVTELETGGRSSVPPFPTDKIPLPSLIVGFGPAVNPTSTSKSPTSMTQTTTSQNIFSAPIAVNAPAAIFPVRTDHPVPRLGVTDKGPHQTNKFYGNFNLGNQNAPAFVHPYSVAWAKGRGASSSWGLSISHIEADQRVYGDKSSISGVNAVRYYINPIGIQSLCLSAVELGSTTALTLDTTGTQSVNVNLLNKSGGKIVITFPLVQGMAFVTAVYTGSTPVVSTGVLFKQVTKSTHGPKAGVTKYTMYLEDGRTWHVYAYSPNGDTLDLNVINNGYAKASKPFNGIIQVAKDPGGAESILDAAAGAYPTSVTLSGTATGSKGTYTFTYTKAGLMNTKLVIYALPHHVDCFDAKTISGKTQIQLQTTTKGMATAIVGDSWTMVEPNMPVNMDFAPWDPKTGPKKILKVQHINTIAPVALKEISQNVDQQSNQDSMYFSGKALAKFAYLCYAVHDLLGNKDLAQTALNNLKSAFTRFALNRQQFPLYYESAWGGIVSSATYQTGNNGADFGNTYYNDHHFHYGYFILAAAIIGHLDPTWLTLTNIDYVNTLVRDVANPNSQDPYFPVSRNFDWYNGHSWAHGLYESLDGKDQESSSEDAMAAYAIKMWGKISNNVNMEARGNLMLSIITRSLSNYYLYTSDNKIQPSNFIGNRVAGILFENKVDHTTYFGNNIEYIQGIHMLPLLPSTKLTRPANFVTQEWSTYFSNGRADKVEGGWRGILYANLATVDQNTAWEFFTQKTFDPAWLDGGVSLTWYQAYTAGKSTRSMVASLGR